MNDHRPKTHIVRALGLWMPVSGPLGWPRPGQYMYENPADVGTEKYVALWARDGRAWWHERRRIASS